MLVKLRVYPAIQPNSMLATEKIEDNFDKYFKDSLKGGPLQNDPLVVKLDSKLKSKTKARAELIHCR